MGYCGTQRNVESDDEIVVKHHVHAVRHSTRAGFCARNACHAVPHSSRMLLAVHVVAGTLALLFATVALGARKGARTHVRAGFLFVVLMMLMGLSGAGLAIVRPTGVSLVAGLLAAYLVATSLTRSWWAATPAAWYTVGAPLTGLVVGTLGIWWGFEATGSADGLKDGHPAGRYFVFGSIALLAAIGDVRWFFRFDQAGTSGRPRPTAVQRQLRHVWRLGVATLMAAVSFFLGQPQVFPEPLRAMSVRVTPVLLLLALFLFWLVRLGIRRVRGVPRADIPNRETPGNESAR